MLVLVVVIWVILGLGRIIRDERVIKREMELLVFGLRWVFEKVNDGLRE